MIGKIEIQEKPYPLKFGYGAFRLLGIFWDCKGVQAVGKKFQEMFPGEGSEEVTFDQADMIGDLVIAGIENADPSITVPEREDVVQEVLFDADKLQYVITSFAESFPQSGKPHPAPKGRKNTARKK